MLSAVIAGLFGLLAVARGNVVVYTKDIPHLIENDFLDRPASFGPDLPFEGLRGLLVQGEPANGCGDLAPPPTDENFTKRWIVLVARYNCSFADKVRSAMKAGYDCVIVHNVDSDELETMSAKDPTNITIPSVFVSEKAGILLADDYNYLKGYYIMVNGDVPFDINTHLLLPFAVVVAICLIIIIIFMIVKCIKDRRRARRHRLPNRSLKKIPTCKFSKGDPYETCAICLDDYQEGERLRVLPCAHAYHAKCVDPWLTQNRRVCPVCKRRVLAAGEREARANRDSDDSDDTEPLLDAEPQQQTQGGTFSEQRENPFSRAARLMSRLRRNRVPHDPEEAPSTEESNQQTNENDDVPASSDTAPLLQPVSSAVAERRSRRARTRRRAHSATAPHTHAAAAAGASEAPALLSAGGHSINTEVRGEIGVAALPAAPQPTSPHHIDL
ncbi:hypothetical protein ABMA27_011471 [Loxostege sticticalis]|uniref:RING-type domain-containing protein n=1 Tax=Loxostege sticticalis TaxID=481309 RepID=A0ABR3IGE8_LOXSC